MSDMNKPVNYKHTGTKIKDGLKRGNILERIHYALKVKWSMALLGKMWVSQGGAQIPKSVVIILQ